MFNLRILAPLTLIPILCVNCAAPTRAPDPTKRARAAAHVLDDFHDAASRADEPRYFAHFAPEGVFLGTDASERWDVPAFRAYAHPHFAHGKGWTYRAIARNVQLAPDGNVAWFDEVLENASYGPCRGTGVLRRIDGRWKIAQYNLTIPIPNDLAKTIVALIRNPPATVPAPMTNTVDQLVSMADFPSLKLARLGIEESALDDAAKHRLLRALDEAEREFRGMVAAGRQTPDDVGPLHERVRRRAQELRGELTRGLTPAQRSELEGRAWVLNFQLMMLQDVDERPMDFTLKFFEPLNLNPDQQRELTALLRETAERIQRELDAPTSIGAENEDSFFEIVVGARVRIRGMLTPQQVKVYDGEMIRHVVEMTGGETTTQPGN